MHSVLSGCRPAACSAVWHTMFLEMVANVGSTNLTPDEHSGQNHDPSSETVAGLERHVASDKNT